jgi:hypothetical protein
LTAPAPFCLVLGLFVLGGCGKYRDFTLPPQPGGPSVTWKWQARPEPVLKRGGRGEWDAVDVLNPSVIRQGDAYYNFFSGYDGKTWHTGLAVSGDGVTWHNEGKILSPDAGTWEGSAWATNGSAIADDSGILYYYQAGAPPEIAQRASMAAQRIAGARHRAVRKLGRARRGRSVCDSRRARLLHVLFGNGSRAAAEAGGRHVGRWR